MNKKFSTLLAGAALLGAVSANAQTAAQPVKKLVEGANSGLYQLVTETGQVLTIEEVSGTDQFKAIAAPTSSTGLSNTLWCVTVSSENQGQAPKYDFMTKTGKFLGVEASAYLTGAAKNAEVTPVVGADVSGWAFSPVFKTELKEKMPLYSYFTKDSVIGLKVDASGVVTVKKALATAEAIDAAGYTKFTLKTSQSIVFNSNELNTVLGTQDAKAGIKLTFKPEVVGEDIVNPFTAKKFLTQSSDEAGYQFVLNSDSSYLFVDTAYTNAVGGAKFLAYNWRALKDSYKKGTNLPSAKDSILADAALKNQFKFKFIYHPSVDSLEVQVKNVVTKEEGDANWASAATVAANNHADWNISLQELIKDKVRILTVAEKQNTKIELGFSGCEAVKTTKTTVADGVYVIKNAKTGKYLAVPIHKGNQASADEEWGTLDLQDATHMPAYQWVVLKTNIVDKTSTSPISVTNREFDDVKYSTVQLNRNEGGAYLYASNLGDSLEFVPVAKEIYSDKYLGYKKLTKDELITNKYTFNYWHPYSSEKYIAKSEKDSTLTVLEGKTAFSIKGEEEFAYGYKVTTAIAGDGKKVAGRIPGLAQLVRTEYQIIYGVDAKFNQAAEDKYAVSKYLANDSVYFKENNHIDGKHYYAIVEGDYKGLKFNKAGVSDYDASASLKVQKLLGESRTSAFFIAPDNTPLYRRFNNAALGENENDGPDSLMFVEKIRKEYLMDEHNLNLTNKNVDFAGIWSKDKAEGKLAFRVDTAWLNRGSGNVKPQYLISVARNDQEAIAGTPCTETDNHYNFDKDGKPYKTDAAHCVHATPGRPGFAYGKYLVNFSDSVVASKYKAPYMDIDGGYTRVGFVKAIHSGDSLFILVNEFKNMEPAKLDTAAIVKSYTAAEINGKYIINLASDQHKNVTWSFRYVNPDKAATAYTTGKEDDANEFLFESNIYNKDGVAVSGSTNAGKVTPTYGGVGAGTIAPEYAAWLKMQNGCLVLTRGDSKFSSMSTGSDGALIFNAYSKTEDDDMVTSNDNINNVEGVSVVAGNGTVTVQGAAGKSVVITNILGKVVAETVLTSDNATIAVPAGIVAVAVDGEEAVKTIVK